MNSEPVVPTLEDPSQLTLLDVSDLVPLGPKKVRPHDKIARLPKVLRALINSLLDDGVPYRAIVERLQQSTDPPLPYPISEMDISRWKNGGYQRYLTQQERFAYVTQSREAAEEMAAADTTTLPEGALQIIASQYYDILVDFSPELLKQKLAQDPLKYLPLVKAFPRLVREIVHLKKLREQAKAAARSDAQPSNAPPSSPADDKAWLHQVDDLFGFKSADRIRKEMLESASLAAPKPSEGGLAAPKQSEGGSISSPVHSEPNGGIDNAQEQSPKTAAPEIQNQKSEIQNPHSDIEYPASSLVHPPLADHERGDIEYSITTLKPVPRTTPNQSSAAPIDNQKSRIENPERCHHCHSDLPPLLADGQRPSPFCWCCRSALHAPQNRHLYCPSCSSDLRIIIVNNQRTLSICPCCKVPLPPWTPPNSDG